MDLALEIDTATNLPALIAERDALRKALGWLVGCAGEEFGTDNYGDTIPLEAWEAARAALALNTKGQP